MDFYNWQTQLRKGLLEVVVLNFLRHGRYHGYDIVQALKKIKGLKIREGNIYPILARLQTDRLVTSHTEPSQDGPPRKYYKLTKLGIKTLGEMNTSMYWIFQRPSAVQLGIRKQYGTASKTRFTPISKDHEKIHPRHPGFIVPTHFTAWQEPGIIREVSTACYSPGRRNGSVHPGPGTHQGTRRLCSPLAPRSHRRDVWQE